MRGFSFYAFARQNSTPSVAGKSPLPSPPHPTPHPPPSLSHTHTHTVSSEAAAAAAVTHLRPVWSRWRNSPRILRRPPQRAADCFTSGSRFRGGARS